jgi:hypothetical protein
MMDVQLRAVAVNLDFVQPAGTVRRVIAQVGSHGAEN